MHMREKIFNLPANTNANIHRSVLEMCNPIKDSTDVGQNNNAMEGNRTWRDKTKNRLRQMLRCNMVKTGNPSHIKAST